MAEAVKTGTETPKPAETVVGTPAAAAATETKTAEQIAADAAAKKVTDDAAAAKKITDDAAAAAAAAGKKPEGGAPEKYELKLPDGSATMLDETTLEQVEKMARANDWTNEDAQAFVNDQVAALTAQSSAWQAQTLADKDYGGDNLAETKRLAEAAINKLRPAGHPRRDSFMRFLNRGGAGNHLEVVSFLADLGKIIGEDTTTGGRGGGKGGEKSAAEVLYGKT